MQSLRSSFDAFEVVVQPSVFTPLRRHITLGHAVAMSTTKRQRRRPSDATSASPFPGAKRLKTTPTSHVPAKSGLGFLLDENARVGKKLEAVPTKGLKKSEATRVNDSHAVLAPDEVADEEETKRNGKSHDVVSISSAEVESDDVDMEEEDAEDYDMDGEHRDERPERDVEKSAAVTMNGHIGDGHENGEDVQVGAEQHPSEEDAAGAVADASGPETEEGPSFAEMLEARHPEPIDVQTALLESGMEQTALMPSASARGLSSLTTLSTALTQALKTNDKERLEKCLSITDLPSIRASIQRLQPHNAVILLQRLSERIHRRPGRTGNLMTWVQWTLVTHGGYFSTQPKIMKGLKSLAQVLRMRASGLLPLLHLKGKLDLLSAQLELRRNMHAAIRAAHGEDQDDEEAVLYVDGQDDQWSDDEDDGGPNPDIAEKPIKDRILKSNYSPVADIDASDNEKSESAIPNGFIDHSDDEGDEDDDENEEALFDDEAEETSNDEDDEPSSDNEIDSESQSEEDSDKSDDDESEDDVKEPHPKTLSRKR